MINTDPIHEAEKIVKEVHDSAGKYARPVLRRYPLLFAFLFTFSAAAIIHGFQLVTNKIEFFNDHPGYLILLGVIVLFFTGTLYKRLEKPKT